MRATYHRATCSYEEYQDFVRKELVPVGIISSRKLDQYMKDGGYIPSHMLRDPQWYFKRQGIYPSFSYSTLFGEYTVKEIKLKEKRNRYLSYDEACKIVKKMKFSSIEEYRINHKTLVKPFKIPYDPSKIYLNFSWYAFLGIKGNPRKVNCKLTLSDVIFIRKMLDKYIPMSILAKQFKVSETQIKRIKTRENWK